jgi:hypothetical protein
MSAPRLDHAAANGTGQQPHSIRLADGKRITIQASKGAACLPDPSNHAGPFTHLEVYLDEGVDPGDGEGWELEDDWELWLTATDDEPVRGRLFYEVPVDDVRQLIEEHGGEHPEQEA